MLREWLVLLMVPLALLVSSRAAATPQEVWDVDCLSWCAGWVAVSGPGKTNVARPPPVRKMFSSVPLPGVHWNVAVSAFQTTATWTNFGAPSADTVTRNGALP